MCDYARVINLYLLLLLLLLRYGPVWHTETDCFTRPDDMFLSKNKQFLYKNISHGSVVTHLWCGGLFHNDFIANLLLSLSVKEF